ncbi:hypothetical protein [Chitinophaga sp. CF418]|uniref:hypothetical protein n=1 Tax=Chitinophaga sp. CF418 TaxID=1855287 RepID=UPI000915EA87|nr:hypothetical protein [Chitinophaga sp. CF418]SHL99389.1 hypothetical protein SAMN05216311_101330 [Chitinophaga sp. CF418]
MNQKIQKKIDQYKKLAKGKIADAVTVQKSRPQRIDGLSKVIRSQKDADNFMAELNSIIKRAR